MVDHFEYTNTPTERESLARIAAALERLVALLGKEACKCDDAQRVGGDNPLMSESWRVSCDERRR